MTHKHRYCSKKKAIAVMERGKYTLDQICIFKTIMDIFKEVVLEF
jgi:hypothetical protein